MGEALIFGYKAAGNKKRVHISWYGGEPLLAKNIIWELSNKFITYTERFGANYSAQIITNGYLLDDETIKNFLKYKITNAQITIDGPSDIHNKRRKLKNSSKPTFDVILNNTKKALEAGIGIALRINVDKTNENRVNELLDTLLNYGLKDAYIYLGHEDYAMTFINFEEMLIKKRFNHKYYPSYPRAKSNSCGADSITSKVIAPDGRLYKCWHDISDPDMSIGNIKDLTNLSDQNIMTQVKYMLFNPFKVKKCKECNVLPLCMGGCPTISNRVSCRNWKYSLVETLKQKYNLLVDSTNSFDILKKEVVSKNA